MRKEKKHENNRMTYILLAVLSLIMIVMILIALIYYGRQVKVIRQLGSEKDAAEDYTQHYVMIADNSTREFWQSVYQGALNAALDKGIYLEMMGEGLTSEYTTEELMRMAIAAKVDGILLASDGSEELGGLIDTAYSKAIPVVTLLRDESDSKRVSHVGISYYNLGQQYAGQLAALISEKYYKNAEINVLVLMDNSISDASRNIVYSTIRDVLDSRTDLQVKVSLDASIIESTTAFAAEESIRSLFVKKERLPDVIICLDEICSACVCQALVDYNRVGSVNLITYYTGAAVLSGISKRIIFSTTGVDTETLGKSGIEALSEYLDTGYTSDYYSVDTFIVDQKDIGDYIGGSEH